MTALCAAGVGGGSLVYQGMTLQPDEAVFNAHFPNELDWARMDRVHYPRVAQMLRLAVAPDELVDSPNYATSRIFADPARKAGFPIDKIPMPIDWDYALAELRGEMAPAYTDGSGATGVNNGGKQGYGVSEGRGHFVYDAARDDAVLRWPHEGDAVLQTGHIDPTVRRITGERSILTDTNSIVPVDLAPARRREHEHGVRSRGPGVRPARAVRARRSPHAGQHRRVQPVDDDRRRRRTRPRRHRRPRRRNGLLSGHRLGS
ncbi:hypothetical protein BO226_23315 [Rhodococcus sp. 2G]|nr:hypothetical protein BO226_23315 [Rhodococcus sp. 2G]